MQIEDAQLIDSISPNWPALSVRAIEFESFYALDMLVPHTKDSNTIVWVTVCLGTTHSAGKQDLLVLDNQTHPVSSNATSSMRRRSGQAGGNSVRSSEQQRIWQLILRMKAKTLLSRRAAWILRDGACSWKKKQRCHQKSSASQSEIPFYDELLW